VTGESDFLSRWSRRKREGAPAEPSAAPEQAVGEAPEAEKTDAEILAEHGLTDPDQLQPGDDIKGFMARTVPERLRNRALRRLWLSNPVLANLDELVDYGDDFTDAATVVETLQTAYRAGQGYLEPEPDPAEPQAGAEETARSGAPPPEPGEATAGTPADLPADSPAEADHADPEPAAAPTADPEQKPPPRRRMAFRFDAD